MVWVCPACEYENEDTDAACAACEEPRPATTADADADADDEYKHFKAGRITACEDIAGSKLKKLKVDVGDSAPIDVVTAASNVAEGQVVAIACVGASVKGETIVKTNVKGFPSCGMVCDSGMLGWAGGGAGAAVQLPAEYPIGSRPPKTRPRGDAGAH